MIVLKNDLRCGFLALSLSSAAGVAGADTICLIAQQFARTDSYPVGQRPGQVELADLDLDGYLDAVVLNRDSGSFTILRGKPGGSFTSYIEVPTGISPLAQSFADLNLDGYIDLLIVDAETDDIAMFLNNGDANFSEHARYPVGDRIRSVDAADFNNDGYTDAICTHNQYLNDEPGFELFLGIPGPGFSKSIPFSQDMQTHDVSIADFNSDGHDDIAAIEFGPFNSRARIYLGRGDATFDEPIEFVSPWSSISTTVTDIDNDGHLDLISVSRLYFELLIFLGNGDGTFADPLEISNFPNSVNVVTSHMDDDDLIDIVVSYEGSVAVYRNLGDLRFLLRGVPNSNHASWVAVADLDSDGSIDLVAPNSETNEINVFLDQCGVCPADLTGDGVLNVDDVRRVLQLDYNRDGIRNFLDISQFIVDFHAGCD